MLDVEVIEDPVTAAVALEPVKSLLLAELATPASAETLAIASTLDAIRAAIGVRYPHE